MQLNAKSHNVFFSFFSVNQRRAIRVKLNRKSLKKMLDFQNKHNLISTKKKQNTATDQFDQIGDCYIKTEFYKMTKKQNTKNTILMKI